MDIYIVRTEVQKVHYIYMRYIFQNKIKIIFKTIMFRTKQTNVQTDKQFIFIHATICATIPISEYAIKNIQKIN